MSKIILLIYIIIGWFNFNSVPDTTTHNTTTTNKSNQAITGFRGYKWGDSKDTIKLSEKVELGREAENELRYITEIVGIEAFLTYTFSNNKLVSGSYILMNKHSNNNLYIEDYLKIKNGLIKKYGSPTSDKTIWKKRTYEKLPDYWGLAVAIGELYFWASWKTVDTQIDLLLYGDNYEFNSGITYTDTNFKELEETNDL